LSILCFFFTSGKRQGIDNREKIRQKMAKAKDKRQHPTTLDCCVALFLAKTGKKHGERQTAIGLL